MQIRKRYIAALAVVLALFMVVHLWQASTSIMASRTVLSTVKDEESISDIGFRHELWQASEFLEKSVAEAKKNDLKWHGLDYSEENSHHRLHLSGKPENLIVFYAWFEKNAAVTQIKGMELSDHAEKKAQMDVLFQW